MAPECEPAAVRSRESETVRPLYVRHGGPLLTGVNVLSSGKRIVSGWEPVKTRIDSTAFGMGLFHVTR
jgi:hypothetical protein